MNRLIRISPEEIPFFVASRWTGRLPALWARGNLEIWERPLAAVIGTRRPSPAGREAARAWAGAVVRAGGVVLSGGAIGVDLEAHRAALEAGGDTLMVPARGLDRHAPPGWVLEYAKNNKCLFVTNLPPEEAGSRSAPVRRNAVVAALADAVLVVESPARSGTAYVVSAMRRRGGPLFAVDYGETGEASAAGNRALCLAGAAVLSPHPTASEIARFRETLLAAWKGRGGRGRQPDLFQ